MPLKCKAPIGKKEVKKSKNESLLKLSIDSMNRNGDDDKLKKILGKDITEKNKQGFPGLTVVKMDTFLPDSSSKEPCFETKEFPIMELNQILQTKSRLSFQGLFS